MKLRSTLVISLLGSLLATGCVSRSAGRAEADALLEERVSVARRRPSDAETAAARKAILAQPLSADAAARLALLHHPDVEAAYAEIGVARADLVRALRLPNPELEGSVRFHDGEPTYDLGASIDITDFVRLAAAGGAAEDDLDAASVEAVGAAMDVALEARRAFYDHVAATQVLEMRRTVAFAQAQSADAARRFFEAGNTAALDATNQQAMFEEARLVVARAEVDAMAARERLSVAIGVHGEEAASWRVPERLADPPPQEIATADAERRALAQSLDLRALRSRYAAAAGRSDLAAWAWFPEIAAGAVAEHDEEGWSAGPQIGLELPIFDRGQAEGDAAEAQMSATRARLRGVATRVRAAARTSAMRLRTAREQALFYKETLLPLRQRVVEETQLQYNAMNTGLFQLLAAKRDQVEAGRAYVEALRDYWVARAEMEQLLAGRMVSGSSRMSSGPSTSGGEASGAH